MNWIEGFKQDYNSCVLERLILVNMDKVVGNEKLCKKNQWRMDNSEKQTENKIGKKFGKGRNQGRF